MFLTNKTSWTILATIFLITLFFIFLRTNVKSCGPEYGWSKDVYYQFGDCRFEVGNLATGKSIWDNKASSVAIIDDIERYYDVPPKVYLIGSYEKKTGFIAINYATGEIEFYSNSEEIPHAVQTYFEKKVTWWCKFKRTCFEEQ